MCACRGCRTLTGNCSKLATVPTVAEPAAVAGQTKVALENIDSHCTLYSIRGPPIPDKTNHLLWSVSSQNEGPQVANLARRMRSRMAGCRNTATHAMHCSELPATLLLLTLLKPLIISLPPSVSDPLNLQQLSNHSFLRRAPSAWRRSLIA